MKPLGFAPVAREDLDAIALYIAEDNPERALSFVAELEARAALAAERPNSFPARDELAPGLRSILHGRYVLFFRELDDEVRIERVLHGAQDLQRIFRQ